MRSMGTKMGVERDGTPNALICFRYFMLDGGWGEIRTHDRVTPMPVFKTGALNHSATHPFFRTIT
jgi:hypothetical protein